MTTELKKLCSNSESSSESCSKFVCDGCSLSGASSDLEKTSAELYSEELDIASSSIQECWQVSAACIVLLGFVPDYFCELVL